MLVFRSGVIGQNRKRMETFSHLVLKVCEHWLIQQAVWSERSWEMHSRSGQWLGTEWDILDPPWLWIHRHCDHCPWNPERACTWDWDTGLTAAALVFSSSITWSEGGVAISVRLVSCSSHENQVQICCNHPRTQRTFIKNLRLHTFRGHEFCCLQPYVVFGAFLLNPSFDNLMIKIWKLIRRPTSWWTMESIVCSGKTSKPSRKSLCNTCWKMLWKVTERTPA